MSISAPSPLLGRYFVTRQGDAHFTEEFSPAQRLRDVTAKLPPQKICHKFASIARLLDAAHQQGCIHRALNPEAIHWDASGTLAISGWEFALTSEQLSGSSESNTPIGAPGYMPPEQARREVSFDPRADLFSLGAMLYEAIAGKPPFEGNNRMAILLATMEQQPKTLRELVAGCSSELSELCANLLEKLPAERPAHAALVAEQLEALSSMEDSHPEESLAPPSHAEAPTESPDHIPQFETLEEIGRGGLGRVSKARDKKLQRVVAIKELLQAKPQTKERFLREALLTARLQHPGIIPIYEAGVWPSGEPFYSMKMVQGEPLDRVFARISSLEKRLALLPQVSAACEAVAYAHSQKIIHRDLKPANILLGGFGETIVIDWGLAKDLTTNEEKSNAYEYRKDASQGLTADGAILGTPAYMPPEQAKGQEVDERADVYSLGAILYHMLAGTPPFDAKSSHEILRAVAAGELPSIEMKAPRAPKDLIAIVQKAMSPRIQDRYPTALGIAEDLKKFQTGQLVSAYEYTTQERLLRWASRYKALLWVAAGALLLITTIGSVSLWSVFDAKEKELAAQKREANAEAEKRRIADERTRELEKQARAQAIALVKSEIEKNPENALALIEKLPKEVPETAKKIWRDDAYSRGVPIELAKLPAGAAPNIKFSRQDNSFFIKTANNTIQNLSISGETLKTINIESSFFNTSSTGRYLAAVENKKAYIIDLQEGTAPTKTIEYESALSFITVSPSEEYVSIQPYSSPSLLLFNNKTKSTSQLLGATDKTVHMRFSPNSRYIASGNADGNLYIWDTQACTDNPTCLPEKIKNIKERIQSFRYTNENNIILSTISGKIIQYDIKEDREKTISYRDIQTKIIEISPSGDSLAVSTVEGVYLWDLNTGNARLLPGLRQSSGLLAFSDDGAFLAASKTPNNELWAWSLMEERAWSLHGHETTGIACAFAPGTNTLISTGADGRVLRWDLEKLSGKTLLTQEISELRTSKQPELLMLSSSQGETTLWAPQCLSSHQTCAPKLTLTIPGETVEQRISADATWLAKIDDRGALLVASNTQTTPKELLASGAMNLNFSPQNNLLVVAVNNNAELWDLSKLKPITIPHKDPVNAVAFSPDGKYLASATESGELNIWDVATQQLVAHYTHDAALSYVEWSPDGSTLALADLKLKVWIVRLEQASRVLRPLYPLEAPRGAPLRTLIFSPEGSHLLEIDLAQHARLWEIEQQESRELPPMTIGGWFGGKLLLASPNEALREIQQ